MESYRIQICSDVDYDDLIAEIYIGGKFVALVTKSGDSTFVVDFPRVQNEQAATTRADLSTFMVALNAARADLIGG